MPDLSPQFDQLKAFIPVGDFVGDEVHEPKIHSAEAGEFDPRGGKSRYGTMWAAKRSKPSHSTGRPVDVWHGVDEGEPESKHEQSMLYDGHHRVIHLHDEQGPNALIAVEHLDQYNIGGGSSEHNPKMLQGFKRPKRSR